MAKTVKWTCRELCLAGKAPLVRLFHDDLAQRPAPSAEVDGFLAACFTASAVSRRSVLFWLALRHAATAGSGFLSGDGGANGTGVQGSGAAAADAAAASAAVSQAAARAAEVHGFGATPSLRRAVATGLASVTAVDSWPALFAALDGDGRPVLAASEAVTARLRALSKVRDQHQAQLAAMVLREEGRELERALELKDAPTSLARERVALRHRKERRAARLTIDRVRQDIEIALVQLLAWISSPLGACRQIG